MTKHVLLVPKPTVSQVDGRWTGGSHRTSPGNTGDHQLLGRATGGERRCVLFCPNSVVTLGVLTVVVKIVKGRCLIEVSRVRARLVRPGTYFGLCLVIVFDGLLPFVLTMVLQEQHGQEEHIVLWLKASA